MFKQGSDFLFEISGYSDKWFFEIIEVEIMRVNCISTFNGEILHLEDSFHSFRVVPIEKGCKNKIRQICFP